MCWCPLSLDTWTGAALTLCGGCVTWPYVCADSDVLHLLARSERAASWNSSVSGSTATLDAPPSSPSQKTYASFDNMLEQSELPVLVDFHTHWCAALTSSAYLHVNCCQGAVAARGDGKSCSVNPCAFECVKSLAGAGRAR